MKKSSAPMMTTFFREIITIVVEKFDIFRIKISSHTCLRDLATLASEHGEKLKTQYQASKNESTRMLLIRARLQHTMQ